jgi:putative FmdB family regulatory protein
MPVYTYRCHNCGNEFDHTQKFTDPMLTRCEACGQETLRKVFIRMKRAAKVQNPNPLRLPRLHRLPQQLQLPQLPRLPRPNLLKPSLIPANPGNNASATAYSCPGQPPGYF